MATETLDEGQRRAMAQAFANAGMPPNDARLVVDIAAKAADDALAVLFERCKLADEHIYLSVLATALQVATATADAMTQGIRDLGREHGMIVSELGVDFSA